MNLLKKKIGSLTIEMMDRKMIQINMLDNLLIRFFENILMLENS
jgi:hypothetical protein